MGLAEFAGAFAENGVDFALLPELTDGDLKELGVLRLADRKRLLRAIVDLNAATVVSPAGPAPGSGGAASRRGAEWRQLTVMFVDLVGSTELSRRLDPEDLRDLLGRYQDVVAGCVARYGGYLAKFLGDGVLAYFGWPQDFEDQAERAVYAGLAAARAVGDITLDGRKDLCARVGIATGQVVVGDLIGEAASELEAVTGETPILAARLQTVAAPGQVVIGPVTHRLVGTTFELRDLGGQALKGFAEPVGVWSVVGESAVQERFEASRSSSLTPLVGRQPEFHLLRDRWALARGGEGQLILLSGEAGIGKSRLLRELREAVRDGPHYYLAHQCSPHHIHTALFPLVRRLERLVAPAGTTDAKLDRLEALLRLATANVAAIAPLIAELLSIPGAGRYGTLDLTPQQRRTRAIEGLVGQVLALSRKRPILFTMEDAQWIDSTTEAFLAELAGRISRAAVLLLVTHRPGYSTSWATHAHSTSVALNRLSRDQSRKIVQLVGGGRFDVGMIDRLVTRADGVPLHIEELSKSSLEGSTPADEGALPATLKASMMARLDQLGDAKQVAQVGAVIGREFSHQLVSAVTGLAEADTAAALVRMVASGLFHQRGTGQSASYEFKHGLVQEAAYDSLLRRRRQQLHGRIASVLEERFPAQVETEPELLALHWEQAQKVQKALDYRMRAARRADKLCAPWESVTHYSRALELAEQLPDTPETRRRFLDALLPLIFVRGEFWRNAAEEEQARRYVEKGLAVARELGDASAIARLGAFAGAFWVEEQLLKDSLAQAEASGDDATRAEVATRHAGYLGFAGRYEQSLAHTKRAIQIFEQLGNRVELGFAFGASARCWSARAGLLEESLRFTEAARQIVGETGNAAVRSWLPMEAEPLMYQGSWRRTVEVAEAALPAAWEIGNWFVVQYTSAWAAIAYLHLGRVDEARRIVDAAVEVSPQGTSDNAAPSYLQSAVAQVLVAEGAFAAACRVARAALDDLERTGNRLEQGFAYRTLGEAFAADGKAPEAEAAFQQSLAIFGEIESQPELAQTLLAYGRFQRDRAPEEGTRLLKRSLALFEAIGAQGWIVEAEAALRESLLEEAT